MMHTLSVVLLSLGMHVIFLAHQIQGGHYFLPTNKEAWYERAFRSAYDDDNTFATYNGSYFGLIATMDVYGYSLSVGQVSSTTIWIANLEGDYKSSEESIWVGWQVYPKHYGDSRTRFFTYWTRDAYRSTGCYDMECPGFEAASGAGLAPGAVIDPVSDISGTRQNLTIKMIGDQETGDWWIHAGLNGDTTVVGRYPANIFDSLSKKATHIAIGGVVGGTGTIPPPPMGSGYLPSDKAATFTDISYIREDGRLVPFAMDTFKFETETSCYSITPIIGSKCTYGGPGCSSLNDESSIF